MLQTTTESQPLSDQNPLLSIHPNGLYRWKQFAHLIPFSRETWRQRVLMKKAPPSVVLSGSCSVWKGSEILEWLADPVGYKHGKENTPTHR